MHFACLSRTRGCLHACQSALLVLVGRADMMEKCAGYFAIRHTKKDKGRELERVRGTGREFSRSRPVWETAGYLFN